MYVSYSHWAYKVVSDVVENEAPSVYSTNPFGVADQPTKCIPVLVKVFVERDWAVS